MNVEKLEHICVQMAEEYRPVKSNRGGNTVYDCPMCGYTSKGPECENHECYVTKLREALDGTVAKRGE